MRTVLLKSVYWPVFFVVAIVISALKPVTDNKLEAANSPMRYHGEFGLYVKKTGSEVEVRWINKEISNGKFQVKQAGEIISSQTFDKSRSHTATFQFTEEGKYTIFYGSDDPLDQYETDLYLKNGKTTRSPYYVTNVPKLYAIGDTHGFYDNLKKLLTNNNLIDENENWIGGKSHLIFLGDLFDRGKDVTKNLWMIYQLDQQAQLAGGRIHIVLGNHEIMAFSNDLRYVTPKERSMAATHGLSYQEMFDLKESVLGEWLASKPSVMKVDKMLFAHGGMVTSYGDFSLKKFNDSVYQFMHEPVFKQIGLESLDTVNFSPDYIKERAGFFYSELGPYWYRGYVTSDSTRQLLNTVLREFKSVVHIVGHTSQPTITQYHRGKLIVTDLDDKATEILLMEKKNKRKYWRSKYDINGNKLKF
ncbi:MAG: metallophosphoesterase [Reichenbachiella sp.]